MNVADRNGRQGRMEDSGDILGGFPPATAAAVRARTLALIDWQGEATRLDRPGLAGAGFLLFRAPGLAALAGDRALGAFVARIEAAGFDRELAVSEPEGRGGLRILFRRASLLRRVERRGRRTLARLPRLPRRALRARA